MSRKEIYAELERREEKARKKKEERKKDIDCVIYDLCPRCGGDLKKKDYSWQKCVQCSRKFRIKPGSGLFCRPSLEEK